MRIYNPNRTTYTYYDKEFGKILLSYGDLFNAFRIFLTGNGNTDTQPCTKYYVDNVIRILLGQLDSIIDWFMNYNKSLTFYASSLLLVYEGNPDGLNEEKTENTTVPSQQRDDTSAGRVVDPIIKMIDFGRVRRQRQCPHV